MDEAARPMVLAFDVATRTGVCYGRVGGRPYLETWDFAPHADLAARSYRMLVAANEIVEKLAPDLIVIEKPLRPAVLMDIGATDSTHLTLVGLAGVVLSVVGATRSTWRFVDRQDVLGHFTGKRTYPKKKFGEGAAKRACVARCRQLGWTIRSDDEADAAALWDYSCALLRSDVAIQIGLSRPSRAGGGAPRSPSEQEKLF